MQQYRTHGSDYAGMIDIRLLSRENLGSPERPSGKLPGTDAHKDLFGATWLELKPHADKQKLGTGSKSSSETVTGACDLAAHIAISQPLKNIC